MKRIICFFATCLLITSCSSTNIDKKTILDSDTYIKNDKNATARPHICVTADDRQSILNKIKQHSWAQKLYNSLEQRTQSSLRTSLPERHARFAQIPIIQEPEPQFKHLTHRVPADSAIRVKLMALLQEGIDCGVMYYLTQLESYAICAADNLHFFIEHIHATPIIGNHHNRGWIYPADHLLESRILNAQVPIIYDFVSEYLIKGGEVYDIHKRSLVPFSFEKAQSVFRRYVRFAIESGMTDTNWPVLESTSLVHNILALDSPAEREKWLPHYLSIQNPFQDPLSKVGHEYKFAGDIWPESIQYSTGVTKITTYLMSLLDSQDPTLKLGRKYPNVLHAQAADKFLVFPNGDIPSFGDGPRKFQTDYRNYEVTLRLAKLNGMRDLENTYQALIKKGLASGDYRKHILPPRHSTATPYKAPLSLLWGHHFEPPYSDTPDPLDRSNTLPFAGLFLQRNLHTEQTQKNGLMAVLMGGHYVHGHAGGMNIELYGKNHVLGIEAGKGQYGTDIHENYYRLFAAHNTVISNGASASKGGWVNLGVETVEKQFMEPLPGEAAVSPNQSFVTATFFDKHNLVAPAFHQRTLAVIRTSPTTGYYLDVARAKSATDNQFHDYVYHNLGDAVSLTQHDQALALTPNPKRYQRNAQLPWQRNNTYRHPGWHWFREVETSKLTRGTVKANFKAERLGDNGIGMQAWYLANQDTTFTKAMAPRSKGVPEPYAKSATPTIILRQNGEAWENPFVAVYEPYESDETAAAVKSVEPLCKDRFCGLTIVSKIGNKTLTQHIILPSADSDGLELEELSFDGHFAIVTLHEGRATPELYIGHGTHLRFGHTQLKTKADQHKAWRPAQ